MRRVTRGALIDAYAQELKDRPPFTSIAGDGPTFDSKRREYAAKDITRAEKAAARLGCTLQLVPVATPVPRSRDIDLNVSRPPADNPGGSSS